MAEITEADLKAMPSLYKSSRQVGEVLIGEDDARIIIEACSSGDDTTLQSLLSKPDWIKTILKQAHSIVSEFRPSKGPDDVRQVTAMPMSHLERALNTAAKTGLAPCVTTILSFAKGQGIAASKLVQRRLFGQVIARGQAAAVRALATAYPEIVNIQIHHGAMPIYEAVRQRRTEVVAVLLELGADLSQPFDDPSSSKEIYPTLLSKAAMAKSPRLTGILLDRGVPIAGSTALHTAARLENLDIMRLLIQHGADVNEIDKNFKNWTPMHHAAFKGRVEAMELLKENGARLDVEDEDGKTPKQLLEEQKSES